MAVPPVPQTPLFLSGPMALLFTNVDGFTAHVVLESGTAARQEAVGELMGRGGSLVFAPALSGAADKRSPAAGCAFIWDVPAHSGCILSGPMQAYAPITPNLHFTNLTTSAATGHAAPEKIDGHLCQRSDATVTASDGSVTTFRLWRAADLKDLPLRVTCTSIGTPLTLTFSKARLESLPNDLFQPPSGFTKHSSAEAMIQELAARQHNLKRRPTYQPEGGEATGAVGGQSPNRP
jgi:hypothetical protein